jgi:hypothetical protein
MKINERQAGTFFDLLICGSEVFTFGVDVVGGAVAGGLPTG